MTGRPNCAKMTRPCPTSPSSSSSTTRPAPANPWPSLSRRRVLPCARSTTRGRPWNSWTRTTTSASPSATCGCPAWTGSRFSRGAGAQARPRRHPGHRLRLHRVGGRGDAGGRRRLPHQARRPLRAAQAACSNLLEKRAAQGGGLRACASSSTSATASRASSATRRRWSASSSRCGWWRRTALDRPHHRRERHRQGAGGPRRSTGASPRRDEPLRGHQLRRHPERPPGERAVRPRARRVHRRRSRARSASSSWPTAARCSSTRSASSAPSCRPSSCACSRSGEIERVGGSEADQRSTSGSSPPPTATSSSEVRRRALPRGPLLPAQRRDARASRRCASGPRTSRCSPSTSSRGFCQEHGKPPKRLSAGGAGSAVALRLAGQRARAAATCIERPWSSAGRRRSPPTTCRSRCGSLRPSPPRLGRPAGGGQPRTMAEHRAPGDPRDAGPHRRPPCQGRGPPGHRPADAAAQAQGVQR